MTHSISLNFFAAYTYTTNYDFKQQQEKGGHKANEKKLRYENRYNKAKSRIIHGQAGLLGLSSSRRLQRIISLSQRE